MEGGVELIMNFCIDAKDVFEPPAAFLKRYSRNFSPKCEVMTSAALKF